MKKNVGIGAVVFANVLVLSVVAINSYKPQLAKLATDYVRIKRKPNNSHNKLEKKRILNEATKIVGKLDNLAKEGLAKLETLNNDSMNAIRRIINPDLIKEIAYACANTFLVANTSSINRYSIREKDFEIDNNILAKTIPLLEGPFLQEAVLPVPVTNDEMKKFKSLTYSTFLGTTALIITLNYFGFESLVSSIPNVNFVKESIDSTIEDIEEFFIDTMDIVVTLNDRNAIIEREMNRIMSSEVTSSEKIVHIFQLERLSLDEKIDKVLKLENINYIDKFDFFLNSGYFTFEDAMKIIISSKLTTSTNVFDYIMNISNITLDEKVELIIHSDLTTSTKVFDYIMNISNLTLDEKVGFIMHSDLTSCERIFDYVLANPAISNSLANDYIINSDIADYDEKFDYFVNRNIDLYDKVWLVLQIPNQSFENVFVDLLSIDGVSQEEIIECIMKTDLISFKTLFDCITRIDGITANQVSNCLVYFTNYCNNGYNTVSLDEIIDYTLNISFYSYNDKVDCIWNLLDNKDILTKSDIILQHFGMTKYDYINLAIGKRDSLTEKESIVLDLFDRIYAIKLDYVMEHYGFKSLDQLYIVISGCAAEGTFDYNDIYWVANTIFNRITHPWYTKKGTNPYDQFIIPKQFSVYKSGDYLLYLNPKSADYAQKYELAKLAFLDMFYLGYDGIEHDYVEFRAWTIKSFSDVYVAEKGNRYNKPLGEGERVIYDEFINHDILRNQGKETEVKALARTSH